MENYEQEQMDLSQETPEQAEARAAQANQIVGHLNHNAMEITEKAIETINNLIEINNDRVEGFEKAAADLQEQDNGLTAVFNKLAGESRDNAAELTRIVQNSGYAPVEGTSTSGALHRAWIDIKTTFTGSDLEAILDECERGEDAIKSAYQSAIDPDNELSQELVQVLQRQQQGIVEGHDLIKSLRDQAAATDDNDENSYQTEEPAYQEQQEQFTEQPSFEGAAGEYGSQTAQAPEPESIEQEEEWQEEQATSTGNSKLMEFFVNELKDLLWAEQELNDALPDMAEAATSQELKNAFTNHQTETQTHIARLEQIFGILALEPEITKCDAMAGIVDEGDEIISDTEEGTAQRDVGLIFAGQKAEHYEIASYGGMISLAKTLGYYEIAELLVLTIDEEKSADALLTEIAENHVNYEASTERAED